MTNGPRKRKPRRPEGTQASLNLAEVQVSFDKAAFMHALRTHGVVLEHYRSIPDPRGMASKGDNHAVMSGHVRSNSDGFIYERVGCMRVLFTTNSNYADQYPEGNINFATAYITLPEYYESNPSEAVIVAPYDRFYMKDIEARVVHRQYVEATTTGLDKLQYPATCVEHLVDANGVVYQQDKDFEVTPDGHIRWLTQKRPGWNVKVGRGTVYAIRYRYTPFFVAARIVHEIRIANITDPATYERRVERMPYQVQIMRENVFYDVNIDPNRPFASDRFSDAPSPGGLLGPDPSGKLGPT